MKFKSAQQEPLSYHSALLPFPKSALAKRRLKIATATQTIFEILVGTGVKFSRYETRKIYMLTREEDAFNMFTESRVLVPIKTKPGMVNGHSVYKLKGGSDECNI